MIAGIGTDIVLIRRIDASLRRWGNKIINRLFTPAEQQVGQALPVQKRMAYYAKRFAAKEAFSKALGSGIGSLAYWREIEVLNTPAGAPVLNVSGKTARSLRELAGENARIHLGLSDDEFAVAFVIIETDN